MTPPLPSPVPPPSHPTRAVFPGQFDPITNGHVDVIRRGLGLFDEVIVGVGINPTKAESELFGHDQRVAMARDVLAAEPRARVEGYTGLTAQFVKDSGAAAILRGIRDVSDLRYEFQLALANRAIGAVETVFVMTGGAYALTSSSLIRQVTLLGGDVATLADQVPPAVIDTLRAKQQEQGG